MPIEGAIDFQRAFGPGLDPQTLFGPLRRYLSADDVIADSASGTITKFLLVAPTWPGGNWVDADYTEANAAIARAVSERPDALKGLMRLNPKFAAASAAQITAGKALGFVGVKLDCESDGYTPLDMALVGPVFELCEQQGWPVLVNTGFHPAQALLWLRAARLFPRVNIVLGHMGHRLVSDAMALAKRCDNVFLETSGQLPWQLERVLKTVEPDRVIFGTDAPYNDAETEMNRLARLALDDRILQGVVRDNAARLINADW